MCIRDSDGRGAFQFTCHTIDVPRLRSFRYLQEIRILPVVWKRFWKMNFITRSFGIFHRGDLASWNLNSPLLCVHHFCPKSWVDVVERMSIVWNGHGSWMRTDMYQGRFITRPQKWEPFVIVIVFSDGWSYFFLRVIPLGCELMPQSPTRVKSQSQKLMFRELVFVIVIHI